MTSGARKPRLAVVSPSLDKRHGTERLVVEWISRLTAAFEIHIYSQAVADMDLSLATWHRIPKIRGPHILNYLWWFTANRLWRAWDSHFRNLRHGLVYSPGINCLDADVMSVHIVFAQYVQGIQAELGLSRNPVRAWPRILHRRLYYSLIMALERRLYTSSGVQLFLIAKRTAAELERFYGRTEKLFVFYVGLDHDTFNPQRRRALREEARRQIGLSSERFALILVGNDWHNKGVTVLVQSLSKLRDRPIDLLLVSREDPAPHLATIRDAGLDGRVHFLPPRPDVEFYYAAADAYVGPSLEDTFALPPQEAMACGMPVIVSARERHFRNYHSRQRRPHPRRSHRRELAGQLDPAAFRRSRAMRAPWRTSRRNCSAIHLGTQRTRPHRAFPANSAAKRISINVRASRGIRPQRTCRQKMTTLNLTCRVARR